MSYGKFEWLKEMKDRPRYAEIIEHLHNETSLKANKAHEKGFAVTEARTE